MRLHLPRHRPVDAWRIFAGGCIAAFLVAIALAAAPGLHDRIHDSQQAEHACAVTLIASSACDHFTHAAPSVAPVRLLPLSAICTSESRGTTASTASSVLEHAPPRLS